MAIDITDSLLTVAEPNTGYPDVFAGETHIWSVDVSNIVSAPDSLDSVSIVLSTDLDSDLSGWSIGASGSISADTITLHSFTVPAAVSDIDHYVKFQFTKDSSTFIRFIPFRAYV